MPSVRKPTVDKKSQPIERWFRAEPLLRTTATSNAPNFDNHADANTREHVQLDMSQISGEVQIHKLSSKRQKLTDARHSFVRQEQVPIYSGQGS